MTENKSSRNAFLISLVVLVIWLIIVLGGEILQAGGTTGLDDLVTGQIVYALIAAPVFLLIVVAVLGWWRQVGLKWVDDIRSLLYLWLPLLGIIVMLVIGFTQADKPGSSVILTVLVNSLLVGISEELMFRGILFKGSRSRFGFWASVWIVSILFGLVHALNGFLTGAFGPGLIQALFAGMAGVMFLGLRVRQNSLFPAMLMHGLWDFSVFSASGAAIAGTLGLIFPPIFFLFGIWLLRGAPEEQIAIPAEG